MREQPEKPIFGPEDPRLDPPNPPEVKPWRALAKAVSWRVVGTLDTLLLSWLIITFLGPLVGMGSDASHAENLQTASYIAITEVITKMVIYYLHERGWDRVRWDVGVDGNGARREGRKRSLVKTGTWRVLASLDTFLLAYLFTGNIAAGAAIGGFEIITKLFLYYFHERAWARIKLGTE